MTEPIKGRVARIISDREVVINRGTADGVRVGMKIVVLDPATEEVLDPETNQVLGSLRRPKVRLEVAQAGDHLALAKTYISHTVNRGGNGGLGDLGQWFAAPKWETTYETLRTDDMDWSPLREADSYVKVGDPFEELVRRDDDVLTGVITPDDEHELEAYEPDEDAQVLEKDEDDDSEGDLGDS